jgi:hypothetical protein
VSAWALVAPLAVQGAAMIVDEGHFHRKRGLGAWERIGHPLDTLTVIACLAWTHLAAPSPQAVAIYAMLAVFSSIFITKDELVHARRCSGGEHWLHAVLFVVHPLALLSVGLLWLGANGQEPAWLGGSAPATSILAGQLAMTAAFCAYQTLYWNFQWTTRAP